MTPVGVTPAGAFGPPAAQRGFALLDALIALAITAVVLGGFVSVVDTSLRTRAHVAEIRAAVPVAQSLLAAATAGAAASSMGRLGGFEWRLTTEPYFAPATALQGGGRPLERVTVEVGRSAARPVVTLTTLRMGGR